MYPPNFNLYRISRGIEKPIKQYMSYKKAKEKVGSAKPTYTSSVCLSDVDTNFSNIIVYESYNIKRNNCQYSNGTKMERLKLLYL